MGRWKTGFMLILLLPSLTGFSYHTDMEKVHRLQQVMAPFLMNYIGTIFWETPNQVQEESIYYTPMEGLDMVKALYAANFQRVYQDTSLEEYYYQLPGMDYYLIYEDSEEYEDLYRLYEFVVDDEETKIGHTVTYGFYRVNRYTGVITEFTWY